MKSPPYLINAIAELYDDIWTSIVWGGGGHGFYSFRGMKQGCPLSGVLFALVLGPVLCYVIQLQERLVFQIGAFADDVYLVARNLCKTLPQ
eukprot:5722253-Pyramimonas_sp.AAC.1